ncbi:hypothetical protein AOLI_G00257000 [Acnodon oligacanthus]
MTSAVEFKMPHGSFYFSQRAQALTERSLPFEKCLAFQRRDEDAAPSGSDTFHTDRVPNQFLGVSSSCDDQTDGRRDALIKEQVFSQTTDGVGIILSRSAL